MNWIQKNVEYTVLIAVLAALTAVTVVLALGFKPAEIATEFSGSQPKAAKLDPMAYDSVDEALQEPSVWVSPTNHVMFRGRMMEWFTTEQKLDIFNDWSVDEYCIPRVWKRSYGMSLAAPDLGMEDKDGDGFLNVEEFRGKTDPTDKTSHPPLKNKLQLVDYQVNAYPMRFMRYEVSEGKQTYQVNLRTPREALNEKKSNMVGEGESFGPWLVKSFTENKGREFNEVVKSEVDFDRSELRLENTRTGEKVVLIFQSETNYPYATANVLNALTGNKTPIALGSEFEFEGQSFKVTKLGPQSDKPSENEAVLTSTSGGDAIVVAPPPKTFKLCGQGVASSGASPANDQVARTGGGLSTTDRRGGG